MSRNCSKCGDTTCNCAIIEGPGIGVTGTGSGASPYIVEADTVHVDTPTVTLTGNGGSTPLSAVVNPCGLTDNLNEVLSGSLLVKGAAPDCLAVLDPGMAGQAVVSNGTEFVLGDAASPNVIKYCDSVTGDSVGYGVIDGSNTTQVFLDLDNNPVASKPASWEPCCCDNGANPIATLTKTGGTPVFVDTGTLNPPDILLRSSPIGSLTLTNPSPSRSIEVIYANQYVKYIEAFNPRGWGVTFTPYLDPGTGTLAAELLNIGGGIKSVQFEGSSSIGSGGAGSNPAINYDATIGLPTPVLILPGASVVIRYQMTMQGGGFMNTLSSVRSYGFVFPQIFSQRFVS